MKRLAKIFAASTFLLATPRPSLAADYFPIGINSAASCSNLLDTNSEFTTWKTVYAQFERERNSYPLSERQELMSKLLKKLSTKLRVLNEAMHESKDDQILDTVSRFLESYDADKAHEQNLEPLMRTGIKRLTNALINP